MIFSGEDNQWDDALCNAVRDWFGIMDTLMLRRRVYVHRRIPGWETESVVVHVHLNVIFFLFCAQTHCNWITWMGTNPACIVKARVRVPRGEVCPSATKWNINWLM